MGTVSTRNASAEPYLDQLGNGEESHARGRLKIFLGYSSGVGKSFRMLDEGRRRRARGQDVVVGAIQPKLPPEVRQIVETLEVIPAKEANGVLAMDVPAIIERAPKVCLVDGLAYNNPPGWKHARRWEDVVDLLDAGISVISSVNLQYIEEKRESVEAITGKHVAETVPLKFLQLADEIVVVDSPPRDCISAREDCQPSVMPRLSQVQLSELREIALLLAADVVDKQLERYLTRHGIAQLWGTQERILVWITSDADAKRMLESGARNRDRFHGELIAAYANRPDSMSAQDAKLQERLKLAREKDAEVVALDGEDTVDELLRFARQRGITQVYVAHKGRDSWWERVFGSDLDRLIRSAEGMDVRVFPHP